MNILVTGGAGYVGSHTVRLLRRQGHSVWVYDNLSKGHATAVLDAHLVQGELSDVPRLRSLLQQAKIEAVMHFAAFSLVGKSVNRPDLYYENNVVGSLRLLQAMLAADVKRIVFSSTTATYGEPEQIPISEKAPQLPINPYGLRAGYQDIRRRKNQRATRNGRTAGCHSNQPWQRLEKNGSSD